MPRRPAARPHPTHGPPRRPARRAGRPAGRPGAGAGTAERILAAAEALAQTRGLNGFSYADVARAVDLTTATLHYHFPAKGDLALALVERYARAFEARLAAIQERDPGAFARLEAYAGLYAEVLRRGRMCLCGVLAAEYLTLPGPVRGAVRDFFDRNEAWLVEVLEAGRRGGELAFEGDPRTLARALVATLEGGLLLARAQEEPARLEAVARRAIHELCPRAR